MSFFAVYIDDMIIFDVDFFAVQKLIANLGKWFRIGNKCVPEWFFGRKIHIDDKRIVILQEIFVRNLKNQLIIKVLVIVTIFNC